MIYFTADRVERVGLNEIVVTNGKFTACEEAVPKWSFTAKEARIKTNDKLKLKNAKFRVKDIAADAACRTPRSRSRSATGSRGF